MEVAGLVFGVLPLAIESIKTYRDILQKVKAAKHDLGNLIMDLENERLMLKDSCEKLLSGIAGHNIDELVQNPFGADWKPYNDKIRLRLSESLGIFEHNVAEMENAMTELKGKLCLEPNGTTKIMDKPALKAAKFVWKKKEYDLILSRIRESNAVIQKLTNSSSELEPGRKARSQARVVQLVRKLSEGIFIAIRSAITCSCAQPHNIGLELVPRNAVMISSDAPEEVAKTLHFHVVLGSKDMLVTSIDRSVTITNVDSGSMDGSSYWEVLQVKLEEMIRPVLPGTQGRVASSASSSASTLTPSPGPGDIKKVKKGPSKAVSFMSPSLSSLHTGTFSATSTLIRQANNTPLLPNPSHHPVKNLCETVHRCSKRKADYYGYILDPEHKFGLFRPDRQPESDACSTITLRDILNGTDPDMPMYGFPENIQIALAVSVSVLHLYKTPWLARILTLDDITFLRDSACSSHAQQPYRPFAIKPLQNRNLTGSSPASTITGSNSTGPALRQPQIIARPLGLTVLSLGALLVQIIIGRGVPELETRELSAMDRDKVLSMQRFGRDPGIVTHIDTAGGSEVGLAVQWCFRNIMRIDGSLENSKFCQDYYENVVARLETAVETSTVTSGNIDEEDNW